MLQNNQSSKMSADGLNVPEPIHWLGGRITALPPSQNDKDHSKCALSEQPAKNPTSQQQINMVKLFPCLSVVPWLGLCGFRCGTSWSPYSGKMIRIIPNVYCPSNPLRIWRLNILQHDINALRNMMPEELPLRSLLWCLPHSRPLPTLRRVETSWKQISSQQQSADSSNVSEPTNWLGVWISSLPPLQNNENNSKCALS